MPMLHSRDSFLLAWVRTAALLHDEMTSFTVSLMFAFLRPN